MCQQFTIWADVEAEWRRIPPDVLDHAARLLKTRTSHLFAADLTEDNIIAALHFRLYHTRRGWRYNQRLRIRASHFEADQSFDRLGAQEEETSRADPVEVGQSGDRARTSDSARDIMDIMSILSDVEPSQTAESGPTS